MHPQAAKQRPVAGPRRFDIRDVMILIVALTPGLINTATHFDDLNAAIRDHLTGVDDKFSTKNWSSLSWTAHRVGWPLANIAIMVLICLPPAQLLFRVRRPRPPSRLIVQQPGTVACLAMVLSGSVLLCLGLLGIISNSFRWAAGPGLSVVAIWSQWRRPGIGSRSGDGSIDSGSSSVCWDLRPYRSSFGLNGNRFDLVAGKS